MEQSTTTSRAECPDRQQPRLLRGAELWRIPIYVADGDVRALLAPAASVRSGSAYLVTGTDSAVRIDTDEHGRLSLVDGDERRPVVLAEAQRMVTRTDLEDGRVTPERVVAAVGEALDGTDYLDDPDDDDTEPDEALCRSCEYIVAVNPDHPACVVCGDANPHAPLPSGLGAEPLFTAPRLPALV